MYVSKLFYLHTYVEKRAIISSVLKIYLHLTVLRYREFIRTWSENTILPLWPYSICITCTSDETVQYLLVFVHICRCLNQIATIMMSSF